MRKVTVHIVHCSDTPDDRHVTVEDIRNWHVDENGWDDVGYHFVIYRDGTIHQGRDLEVIGSHCYRHNRHSIGTCMVGRDDFTAKQYGSLLFLNNLLKKFYPGMHALGHRDLNPDKTCPNFEVAKVLKS